MVKLFIVLIILLGIIAIAQLMRVLELSSDLRNKKEEEISEGDNKLNANLMFAFMIFFFGSFIWLMAKYGGGSLPVAASKHGAETDWLLKINFAIIILVFFATNFLLFFFANRYYYRKDRKALYYPHNNKLELLWTVVPACVLAVIIILGLKTWNDITAESDPEAVRIELYSKQFEWVARYSGDDNQLGRSDFRLVSPENPLGVQTNATIDSAIVRIEKMIVDLDSALAHNENPRTTADVMTDATAAKTKAKKERMMRHLKKVIELKKTMNADLDKMANDDRVIKLKEIHLIQGQEYEFLFRSQDVIHSAYFPHFRAQMNTVPGMTTRFRITPTITTDSMRTVTGNPKFDYILLCNKICGAAHYNMQMVIKVDKPADYKTWYEAQPIFAGAPVAPVENSTPADSIPVVAADTAKVAMVEGH